MWAVVTGNSALSRQMQIRTTISPVPRPSSRATQQIGLEICHSPRPCIASCWPPAKHGFSHEKCRRHSFKLREFNGIILVGVVAGIQRLPMRVRYSPLICRRDGQRPSACIELRGRAEEYSACEKYKANAVGTSSTDTMSCCTADAHMLLSVDEYVHIWLMGWTRNG